MALPESSDKDIKFAKARGETFEREKKAFDNAEKDKISLFIENLNVVASNLKKSNPNKHKEYLKNVEILLNDLNTNGEEIRQAWLTGCRLTVNDHFEKAEKSMRAFEDILSGAPYRMASLITVK
jgi:hypothetical protein